jgi:CheY-like chemotaxis protein
LLELRGIETQCAGRWSEAIDALATDSFDLVIVDLNLPDSTAEETASTGIGQLRSMDLLVVALTGVDDPELIRHFQRQRVPFVLKPIVTNDFIKTVLTELEWHAPSRELEHALMETGKVPPVTFGEPRGWWSRNSAKISGIAAVVALLLTIASQATGGISWLWSSNKMSAQEETKLRMDVDQTVRRIGAVETGLSGLKDDVTAVRNELAGARQERQEFSKRLDRIDGALGRQETRTDQILTLLQQR